MTNLVIVMVDFFVRKYSELAKVAYLSLFLTMGVIMGLTAIQMIIGEPKMPMFPWNCGFGTAPCVASVVLPWYNVAVVFIPVFLLSNIVRRRFVAVTS